jgi:hypothetical protein
MQILKKQHLESQVKKALTELPETLDETYERILINLPPESKQYVWRALALLISVSSVQMEVLVSFVSRGESTDQMVASEVTGEALQEMASCLITVTTEGDDSTVQLAHYTIMEYLAAPRVSQGPASMFYMPQSATMPYFLRLLFNALAQEKAMPPKADPFQQCVYDELDRFLYLGDTVIASDSDLFSRLLCALSPQSNHYKYLTHTDWDYEDLPIWAHQNYRVWANQDDFSSESQVAILFNLLNANLYATTTTFLLQHSPEQIDAICATKLSCLGDLSLLYWLASTQRDKFLLLLLERSGEFHKKRAPLLLMALEREPFRSDRINTTVSTLISAGLPLNPDGVRVKPLQIAVRRLQVAYVELLLRNGADPNSVGDPEGWISNRLGHFDDGGQSPLFIVRQLMKWRDTGVVNPEFMSIKDAEHIETLLVDAGGQEFCSWSPRPIRPPVS